MDDWQPVDDWKPVKAAKPEGFMANAAEFVKSLPIGAFKGITGAQNTSSMFTGSPLEQGLEQTAPERTAPIEAAKAEMHQPQGIAGHIGSAVAEGLATPASYIGPGSLPLKIGGAVLSSGASEAAGQATEGTKWETPARIAAALTGGVVAGKTLGSKAATAEIPASRAPWKAGPGGEKIITGDAGLKEIADAKYGQARAYNVELNPHDVAGQAKLIENKIGKQGWDADTAPVTTKILHQLQSPDGAELSTLSNLDALRQKLNKIAKQVDSTGQQTSDAAAATTVKRHLGEYLEGDVLDHVVVRDPQRAAQLVTEHLRDQPGRAQQVIAQARAGDTAPLGDVLKDAAKANATKAIDTYKEANKNWAAYRRAKAIEDTERLGKNQAERQTAGSESRRIRINVGKIQDKITKSDTTLGYSGDEIAGIAKANRGGVVSRALDQGGRLSGALPLMLHGLTAVGTGFAHLPVQAAIAGSSYGAKKIAEVLTRRQINKLSETMRKRSPEYERRLANMPPTDRSPNYAAIARALAGVH